MLLYSNGKLKILFVKKPVRLIETITLLLSYFESLKTNLWYETVISLTQPQTVLSNLSFISLGFRDLALRCIYCPNFPLVKLSSVQFVICKFNRTKNVYRRFNHRKPISSIFCWIGPVVSSEKNPKNGEWLLF